MLDGAVNSLGAGVGIILKTPSQQEEQRCVRLDFPTSNNQAEYEALIIGLLWAKEVGVQSLEVYSDSQVVVRQMNDEYAVKSDNLKEYATMAKRLSATFEHFQLRKISRSENTEADKLAKMASGEPAEVYTVEVET